MGKKRSKGIIHNFKGNASRSKKGEEGEEVEDLQTELNQEIKERDWNKNQNKNVYQDFQKSVRNVMLFFVLWLMQPLQWVCLIAKWPYFLLKWINSQLISLISTLKHAFLRRKTMPEEGKGEQKSQLDTKPRKYEKNDLKRMREMMKKLQTEMEEMKAQMLQINDLRCEGVPLANPISKPTSFAAPPPPPPPPPVAPLLLLFPLNPPKRSSEKSPSLKHPRIKPQNGFNPAEILGIKLKKSGDKQDPSPLERAASLVSLEALKQVKLRKTEKNQGENKERFENQGEFLNVKLKKHSEMERSPGGTPLRVAQSEMKENSSTSQGLTPMLSFALKKKFMQANTPSPKKGKKSNPNSPRSPSKMPLSEYNQQIS